MHNKCFNIWLRFHIMAESMGKIYVLRIGHRPKRDVRITTHVGLVSRAFGADGFILEGDDPKVVESISKVLTKWGGRDFEVGAVEDAKAYVEKWKAGGGAVAHLTMYGLNISGLDLGAMRKRDLLIVAGAEKVDRWYYDNADYNIAIGNQPHSEVAAVAIMLDRLGNGLELDRTFTGGRLRIIGQARGKKVE
ncbi:MAG: protein of unknown function DUF127 [Candidatus Micrarchaeum acidiphilum ARMAN-2]|uniref:tRNA (cytidine(56)-2'-O)-methyltransferase n=1 Tax=Candidatus Micrarchaeum acidiphilum ARMAN-2 TaxID=425595 RepID=C7DHU0_MICA2|nr:MAG: protein of unknown function DUF127 [Candidatus Micrarchaeum acidiphilum ARMAN-2]